MLLMLLLALGQLAGLSISPKKEYSASISQGQKQQRPDNKLQEQVELLFRKKILPFLEAKTVAMYNTCKIKEVLYRGDPKYFVSKEVNEGWHDWAYMDRGAMGEVPVHIMYLLC